MAEDDVLKSDLGGERTEETAAHGDALAGATAGADDAGGATQRSDGGMHAADPFAASIAADAAKHDPELKRKTAEYLAKQGHLADRQRKLVDLQIKHFDDEKRRDRVDAACRRIGDWLKNGYQLLVLLAGTLVVVGLLVLIYGAVTSQSVVVNVFKTPSGLAGRGITGDVVASGVLDRLQELQDATRAVNKGLNARSAWASDIKIQVPQTGVSVGELDRFLHDRLSRDVHIDGDLIETDGGALALTVRGDGVPAKTFPLRKTFGLDSLTRQAAKYVYGRSRPYEYLVFLESAEHFQYALDFVPDAFAGAKNDDDRAELAVGWGNAFIGLNKPKQAAEKFRLALLLKPRYWKAWGDLVTVTPLADGEEAGWKESVALLRAAQQAPRSEQPELRYLGGAAANTWDLPLALESSLADAARNGGVGTEAVIEGPAIADDYALMHNPAQAARYMAESDPHASTTKVELLLLKAYDALDREDGAAAVPPLKAFWNAWLGDRNLQANAYDGPCLLGLAYGLAGRRTDAVALFKQMGRPCSRCYAMHGDILARSGDLAGAQHVWAKGLRIAPDLPHIYLHRGIWEMRRGDLKRAGTDLSTASAKAPHWADPLKAWGDLLARSGQWRDAVTKYDEGLKYAPSWSALHDARNAAAAHVT